MYIYLDESGTLGFDFKKKGNSKYFTISYIAFKNKNQISRAIRSTRKKFNIKSKLKANSTNDEIRKDLLNRLMKKEFSISTIIIDKTKVYSLYMIKNKEKFYNYMCGLLIDTINLLPNTPAVVNMVMDKRKNGRLLKMDINNYLKMRINRNSSIKLEIEHKHIDTDLVLTAVDFISWSVFRNFEHGDNTYYKIIERKILQLNKWPL